MDPSPSQVTIKTVLTVMLGIVGVGALVVVVGRTVSALTLTTASLMIAVTLDHGVAPLHRHGIPRPLAICIVLAACAGMIAGLAFIVIPVAIGQGEALFVRLPGMFTAFRSTRIFHTLDDRLHIAHQLQTWEQALPKILQGAAAPVLAMLGGVLSGVAAVVTVMVLTIFMLVFGGRLVRHLLRETLPRRRHLYATLIEKTYQSIGGYLLGLWLICLINASLSITFLAIVRIPFFLPLGILSGISSLIPYAGPIVVAPVVTAIALATGGTGTGIACGIFFLAYGQLEGQVLSPTIFRRTVHVNPLIVVLSVLFFSEVAGIFGAVVAVPAAAIIQIGAREILRARRERLHLAATPLNSPDRAESEA